LFFKLSFLNDFGQEYQFPLLSKRKVLALAKTGDIVIFSNKGKDAMIIKGWSDSPWTHVGIIYRDPKTQTCYLWHCDPVNYRRDAGLRASFSLLSN
jgi:hypothetical protein